MYSSVHGVTGAIIMISAPNPIIGVGAAFISHFIWDYVGESSIGNTRRSIAIEGALLLAFIIGAIHLPLMWYAFIGWAMGNLPDIIDKPNRLLRGKKEWFSSHNGTGFFQFMIKGKMWKLGWPVAVRINRENTLLFNTFATIIWLIICLFF